MKKLVCRLFGHRWRYNFPSQPNKAICKRCHRRERMIFNEQLCGSLNLLGEEWVEGFDDKRTDKELINKWFK